MEEAKTEEPTADGVEEKPAQDADAMKAGAEMRTAGYITGMLTTCPADGCGAEVRIFEPDAVLAALQWTPIVVECGRCHVKFNVLPDKRSLRIAMTKRPAPPPAVLRVSAPPPGVGKIAITKKDRELARSAGFVEHPSGLLVKRG